MHARHLILGFFALFQATANAQYVPDTVPALPLVCDVFILPSGQAESMYAVGLEQWRQLAPNSELLARDLSDHMYNNQRDRDFVRSMGCAMSISLRLGGAARTKRSGTYLRAGFAYQNHEGNDLSLKREVRTPFDTLTSSQTGQTTYIDSLTISRYDLGHTYRQLALDASLIFLKEYPKRWSLYGGGGVQVGFAFDGRVGVNHSIEQRTDPMFITGNGSSGSGKDFDLEYEEFRTKDDLCMALYVPLGVSYRLGMKRAFWRAINLAYELRPAVSFGGVPELDAGARVGIGQFFGLRVDLVK